MSDKLHVVFIGCGRFCRSFVPLFKAHPAVASVGLCDLIRERAEEFSKVFQVEKIYDSFEDVLKDPKVNAVAIFTQRHLHAPLVKQALRAGKHVYSAVPTATTVEDIQEIEQIVRETRLVYATGETGAYRPCTVFCREKMRSGEFRNFVYGEAQYNHDMRHFYDSYKYSGGENWRQVAGFPPMLYPTHSTAMILSCLPGVYARKVSAFGYTEKHDTDIFGKNGVNLWDNPFSNTTALLHLSNDGIVRLSENRRIGWYSPQSYISNFHTETGSYEFAVAHHYFCKWDPADPKKVILKEVSDQLNPPEIQPHINEEDMVMQIGNGIGFRMTSPIQPLERIPQELHGLPNGHNGTHHFMTDDFCKAVSQGKLPPTNIWQAARFNLPGIIANQSALKDGETMDVPDLGEPPADWEVMPF
ncbi:MAG: Gfo/Idh/MocA family oxidoreductase [Victivallales bacterium]|nr:Gfo/Idh/MocA family oxidoreductase [Victivallales bacterium]